MSNDRKTGLERAASDAKAANDSVDTAPEQRAKGRRSRRVETVESFAKRTEAPAPAGRQRRASDRARTPLAEIKFPHKTRNMNALRFALRLVDSLWVIAVISLSIYSAYVGTNNRTVLAPLMAGVSGMVAFFFALAAMKAHRFAPTETYWQHIRTVALGTAAALGVWLSASLIIRPLTFLPNSLAVAGVVAAFGLIVLHSSYYLYIRSEHKKGALIPSIIMLGATESARRLIEENARTRELNILAIFDERLSRAPHNIHGVPVVGKIADMLGWDALPYVDRIVVTLPKMAESRKAAFVEQVRLLPNRIAFLEDEFENLNHVQQRVTEIAEIGMREVTGKPKSGVHVFLKRIMDIGISGLALTLGAPVLLIIAVLIKLDSKGPVLFKQNRHGFNNRIFGVYKFRSLRVEAEDKQAKSQVVAGDNRVTKVGRIIRKTSLDELPQLLNVLKGEMSLVGPRPHAVGMHTGDTETYKLVEEYAHRHKVKPGMTGWAQINGSRGPLHDAESVARRITLDMEYIERANVFFDLVIMAKTIPCLLGDSENVR